MFVGEENRVGEDIVMHCFPSVKQRCIAYKLDVKCVCVKASTIGNVNREAERRRERERERKEGRRKD